MNNMTLEERVAALEQAVLELRAKQDAPRGILHWLENQQPMSPELQRAHEEAEAYGRYFRRTGKEAPPDWKPGDPIPEPDEEWFA